MTIGSTRDRTPEVGGLLDLPYRDITGRWVWRFRRRAPRSDEVWGAAQIVGCVGFYLAEYAAVAAVAVRAGRAAWRAVPR